MKIKQIVLLLFVLFGILFMATSCLDSDECVQESYRSPDPFVLKVVDEEGTNLISEEMFHPDSIKLYYNDDLGKTIVDVYFNKTMDGNVLISNELPNTILETAINTYFLYLNYTDTDTLYVDIQQGNDGCNIWYYYFDCMYNNKNMEINPPTYIFVGVK